MAASGLECHEENIVLRTFFGCGILTHGPVYPVFVLDPPGIPLLPSESTRGSSLFINPEELRYRSAKTSKRRYPVNRYPNSLRSRTTSGV